MRKIILLAILMFLTACSATDNAEYNKENTDAFADTDRYIYNSEKTMMIKLVLSYAEVRYLNVVVYDDKFNEIFCARNRYRARDALHVIWDDEIETRFWVYNGDTGTSYWDLTQNGEWVENYFFNNKDQTLPKEFYAHDKKYYDIVLSDK